MASVNTKEEKKTRKKEKETGNFPPNVKVYQHGWPSAVNAHLIASAPRETHYRSHERFPISDVTDIARFKETGRERGRPRVWSIDTKYRWLSARPTSAALVGWKVEKEREKKTEEKDGKEERESEREIPKLQEKTVSRILINYTSGVYRGSSVSL